jgi:excinuclease ABC subunit C
VDEPTFIKVRAFVTAMISVSKLPLDPGCYLFKDQNGTIVYVGKAKNLRKRVASYFSKKDHDIKTRSLVKAIADIDFIATQNEVEAFILENNLIKRHQPKYNIDLKDSKRFAFIQLTDESYPRLLIARKRGPGCYGPFVSAEERDRLIVFLRRLFSLRTCKRLPKTACLRHHIGLCSAPCIGKISREDYHLQAQRAARVLAGHSSELITQLKEEMAAASRMRYFEVALRCRDQINALKYLDERQNMERGKTYDEDIFNYVIFDDMVHLMLFNVHKGTLINKQEFTFPVVPEFLSEFIVQYYAEHPMPRELMVPENLENALQGYLEARRRGKVTIIVPKLGEKRQLLELVKKNIELASIGDLFKVNELGTRLKMHAVPAVIECFDISHLSGTLTVGSMVQFRNGRPDKANYRRFRLKAAGGGDDTAALTEVITRRYQRLIAEGVSLPDLIIVDGGKPQLSAALAVLESLGLRIPTITIAKRLEEIYLPGLGFPLKLDRKDRALQFIQEIRDEAHRFALKYQRLLRSKKLALDRKP